MTEDMDPVVVAAKAVLERAYAPYSRFRVGAAVRSESGRVYAGCNVENASYGATLCAERNAIAQLVAAGERSVTACAVVIEGDTPATPCGICRQVLAEFASDVPVTLIAVNADGRDVRTSYTLGELLPHSFRLDSS